MRNLALWKSSTYNVGGFSASNEKQQISTIAVDLEQDVLYAATEVYSAGDIRSIDIWKLAREGETNTEISPALTCFASYPVIASMPESPWPTDHTPPSELVPEVVNMRLLPDIATIVLTTRSGEIVTLSLEDDRQKPESVGSVDGGILAATWSPDDTLLVIITGDDKLLLMTSSFDVIFEGPLHPDDFGEDAPIALGWGAKHTQFHGSLGKGAAQAALDLSEVGSSPDDDGKPRVSWRGDGAFFVVSTIFPPSTPNTRARRILRIYSREGHLSSSSEPVAGLEHTLSWRPSGNLIAGTQRYGSDGLGKGKEGRHDVVFFERNGLRHGDFGLRENAQGNKSQPPRVDTKRRRYKVQELSWSADSTVLSVWVAGDDGDIVQLWTTGNYHWYLKHEITAPRSSSGDPGRFTSVFWHPEEALKIILTTPSELIERVYTWETYTSISTVPNDSGSVAVIDGSNILLTPFRTQNVPPPMASHTLFLSASTDLMSQTNLRVTVPLHTSFATTHDLLVLLWESGYAELFDLRTRLSPGRGKVMDPLTMWTGQAIVAGSEGSSPTCRQVILLSDRHFEAQPNGNAAVRLAILSNIGNKCDVVHIITIEAGELAGRCAVEMPGLHGRLSHAGSTIVWQAADGTLYDVNFDACRELLARFPEFCYSATSAFSVMADVASDAKSPNPKDVVYIGLGPSGHLHVAVDNGTTRSVATNATSFIVASGFLIYTTTAHVAHFAPISRLHEICSTSVESLSPLPEWETRRVERGSRIVTAVPSAMSLVLQMPRGNLETINPRPLVMEIVKQDIDNRNYRKAFLACRKHRIDLSVFAEYGGDVFKSQLQRFVEQVDEVDYINLFLTSIGQSSLPADLVTKLCDGIRAELEKRDLKKYVSCILTTHVVKRPPDHEAGLSLLLRLRDSEPQLVEDAVKYIIFLVDTDRLFDTALGMYDFSLVLIVAQHAQKDPQEYLPFLRELRSLEHHYQRFRIDDHLKRYEKALQDLADAGQERFEEAMAYVEKHRLYESALAIWLGSDRYSSVLSIYGDWLFERRDFREAAFVFRQAGVPLKAMAAHEKALEWKDLFELAIQESMPSEELISTAYRVADDLSSKKRYADAAQVLLDYAQDVREAIKILVEGSLFSEARRIIALKSRKELLEELVYPGTLDCRAQIAEDMHEMREQLRKQVQRIRELRVRKVEEPDAFYGNEDTDLHNVDVMTDVSMAPTTFTRYTQAPTAISRTTSKRSSRSKRKLERKVGSGRKGTVDEEEYLLKSVSKLVVRFNASQSDAAALLPHLFQFTEEHRTEACALQEELRAFEAELQAAVTEIWTRTPADSATSAGEGDGGQSENAAADGWAARMREYERQRQVDPLEKVARPELARPEWTLKVPGVSVGMGGGA
ncbi:uncharacterized protein FIBRA_07987 [Fibroporia radiculosa]|uniref:Elongator complex protein 1 n=1 Tax=Fibroporia radiculosa TaxID=599839 RepID=J4GVZ3_9APHY|nr:uncharacterized protein FIBRA_07987 [Fibroporia radiculosa]CCM05755.1 predicted protein [Fibroporia radiculosa]